MREVAATDAKAHLAELLRHVEQGEAIAITRHGKSVAHLMPSAAYDQEPRKAALEEFLREWATWPRTPITQAEIRTYIEQGRM